MVPIPLSPDPHPISRRTMATLLACFSSFLGRVAECSGLFRVHLLDSLACKLASVCLSTRTTLTLQPSAVHRGLILH